MLKDLDKLETAIIEKYGEEVNFNLDNSWTVEKEKEYLSSLKSILSKEQEENFIISKGYLQVKKLLTKDGDTCIVCKRYSAMKNDSVYLTKYECCEKCYWLHVEGREDKWQERKHNFKGQ
jgi:hypothetical protein